MTACEEDKPKAAETVPPWESDKLPAEQEHDRVLKVFGAYTGFVAAGVLALLASDGQLKSEAWTLCLWIFSLPPLIAYQLLDYHVRVRQKRRNSAVRGIMLGLGVLLSNLGVTALLTSFSWTAAILYPLLIVVCFVLVREVAGLGWLKGFEEI